MPVLQSLQKMGLVIPQVTATPFPSTFLCNVIHRELAKASSWLVEVEKGQLVN